MKNIQITARFKINDGKLEEFKRLADNCIAVTKEKDQNTLQYDWFFSEDETECIVREIYSDSNAVLSHMGNLGDLLEKIIEVSDFEV
jgi:quinol monooxygenase YgiN